MVWGAIMVGRVRDHEGTHRLYVVNLSSRSVPVHVVGVGERPYAIYEYARDRLPGPDQEGYGTLDALRRDGSWNPIHGPLELRPETLVLCKQQRDHLDPGPPF